MRDSHNKDDRRHALRGPMGVVHGIVMEANVRLRANKSWHSRAATQKTKTLSEVNLVISSCAKAWPPSARFLGRPLPSHRQSQGRQ